MNYMFIFCVNFCSVNYYEMNYNIFLEFFKMYYEVQILVICNNHEFDVGMNFNVKFVET